CERPVLLGADRVHCADLARQVVDTVEQRKDCLLVRRGDVAAAQAECSNAAYRGFELFGWYGKEHVAPGNAVMREPMIVDDGRARVRDRPAEKARDTEGVMICHGLIVQFP